MRNERAERERVARRWALANGVFVTLTYLIVVVGSLARWARRDCTSSLYGAYRPPHYCSLDEARAWVEAGASVSYWVFAVLLLGAGIIGVVAWLRSLRD